MRPKIKTIEVPLNFGPENKNVKNRNKHKNSLRPNKNHIFELKYRAPILNSYLLRYKPSKVFN